MARISRESNVSQRAAWRTSQIAAKLGRQLRAARLTTGLTQKEAAARAGLTQSTWSWLELSGDPRVTLSTWLRAGSAVRIDFDAFFRGSSAADQPRDAAHLRAQNLIIATAARGGWRSVPEHPIDREVRSSRSADVLLQRGLEYALADVWDWFDDVGAAQRAWHSRLDAVERLAIARMVGDQPLPRVSGLWVVRATVRNKQLIHDHREFFRAAFPGRGEDWLTALSNPATPMPNDQALLLISVPGDRLIVAGSARPPSGQNRSGI